MAAECAKDSCPVGKQSFPQQSSPRLWILCTLFPHLPRTGHLWIKTFPGHNLGSQCEPCPCCALQACSQCCHGLLYSPGHHSVARSRGWAGSPEGGQCSDVGLGEQLFEPLSHSHKKATLTKAVESSEHLFRQQNWKTDFLSCVITHTPCPRIRV